MIKIKISPTPWSENQKSWLILSLKGQNEGSFYSGYWYPKSLCNYTDGIMEMPLWLFEKYFNDLENKPEILL